MSEVREHICDFGRQSVTPLLLCNRCMRHFAIYACRWPERTPTDGTPAFLPTPREQRSITPAYLSQKNLATLNHKLSNAASGSRSASAVEKRPFKRQRSVEPEGAPSPKRPKVEPVSTSRGRGRPPKNKVGMSNKARELLGMKERRSSRTRVPSLKMRESEPPPKGKGASSVAGSSKAPVSTASTSSISHPNPSESSLTPPQTPTSDRHLRSTGDLPSAPVTPVTVKTEAGPKLPTPKSLAVASQPREANGRFGKKASTNGKFMRRNFQFAGGRRSLRHKRPKPRSKTDDGDGERFARTRDRPGDAGSDDALPLSHKRSQDDREDAVDERGKRRRLDEDDEPRVKVEGEETDLSAVSNENDEGTGSQDEADPEPITFRRPFLAAMKSGVGLYSRPNPHTFARRKWTSSVPPEEPPELTEAGRQSSTTDDDTLPVTPEDEGDQPLVVADDIYGDEDPAEQEDEAEIDSDDSGPRMFSRPKLMVNKPALAAALFKPNPLNMARRRWAPTPTSGGDEIEPEEYADLSLSKTTSRTSQASFGDLFEPEPIEESLDVDRPAPGNIDPEVSSEEVS